MNKLIQQFQSRLKSLNFTFKRYLCKQINWNNRLIAIIGARGVGKTTLLLQHIKENHKDTFIPIIALTANTMAGDKDRFLAEGMDGYLSKPIDVEKLGEVLKEFL